MITKYARISLCVATVCAPLLVLAAGPFHGADADADRKADVEISVGGAEGLATIPPANLLVDRAHSGDFDVGGLTDFLIANGWTVDELHTPVTAEALTGYDVFLIPSNVGSPGEFPGIDPYTAAELEAVFAFVEDDNGLWCLTEYNRDQSGVNSVASLFGVSFYGDVVIDPVDNVDGNQSWPVIEMLTGHPIGLGVASFGYYAGCCVGVADPAVVVATGGPYASSNNCPDDPPVLAAYENGGRAVFSGDSTPLYPGYPISADHWQLLANTAEWLARGQVIATESTGWSRVKSLYR